MVYTCCQFTNNSKDGYIGTSEGELFRINLKSREDIINPDFQDQTFAGVINQKTLIAKFQGTIRSIQCLDENTLLIIIESGSIIEYNISTSQPILLFNNISAKRAERKIWRLLVINEFYFVTSGNYGNLVLWKKEGNSIIPQGISGHTNAIFCLDWVSRANNIFLTNDHHGITNKYQFIEGTLKLLDTSTIEPNLQKIVFFEDYAIATDYFGKIFLYNAKDFLLQKFDEFSILPYKGNWVYNSEENNRLYIGTDGGLFVLTRDFETLTFFEIPVIQMINLSGLDLFLTRDNLIRVNLEKQSEIKNISEYAYLNIGLIGDSEVGKTTFCYFLESMQPVEIDADTTFGRHVWRIPFCGDENRQLIMHDLAGQSEELYSHFPTVYNADIILLFFSQVKQDTFDLAFQYYGELKKKCQNADFFFIQNKCDKSDRTSLDTIKRKLNEVNVDYSSHLFKISSKKGEGIPEFLKSVFHEERWAKAHRINQSQVYKKLYMLIHRYYKNRTQTKFTLNTFWEHSPIDTKRLEKFILHFYKEGMIDYIQKTQEILINDEKYSKCYSEISKIIRENEGFIDIIKILKLALTTEIRNYYLNIIRYYMQNDVAINAGMKLIIPRLLLSKERISCDTDAYSSFSAQFTRNCNLRGLVSVFIKNNYILNAISKVQLIFKRPLNNTFPSSVT